MYLVSTLANKTELIYLLQHDKTATEWKTPPNKQTNTSHPRLTQIWTSHRCCDCSVARAENHKSTQTTNCDRGEICQPSEAGRRDCDCDCCCCCRHNSPCTNDWLQTCLDVTNTSLVFKPPWVKSTVVLQSLTTESGKSTRVTVTVATKQKQKKQLNKWTKTTQITK